MCQDLAQTLKVEHIDDDLKQYPTLSFYRQGEFIDLCRGPHLPHAGKIGAFKLLSIAGAYWKNDATRKQLQRLYATAFFSQKDLDAYLHKLEEAKKRDHRVLGKQLKLFTISPLVGSGLILWMPKGATVRGLLETFIKDELLKRGYQPVYTPHIGRLELYRTSAAIFPYYRDAQFPPIYFRPAAGSLDLAQWRLAKGELDDTEEILVDEYLKTAGFYPAGYKEASTREKLELVHRHTKELLTVAARASARLRQGGHGQGAGRRLARLAQGAGRLSAQADELPAPHPDLQGRAAQLPRSADSPGRVRHRLSLRADRRAERHDPRARLHPGRRPPVHHRPIRSKRKCSANIELVLFVLSSFGLNDYRVRVGLRDPQSDKYVGRAEDWDTAEKALVDIVKKLGMNYTVEAGEAAFYGPKIDFVVRDCIGREWQLGTVQLDLQSAAAFRAGVRRRRQSHASAGDDPSRPVRLDGALHGHSHRALRRRVPAVAGSGAGPHRDRQREVQRLWPEGREGAEGPGLPRRTAIIGRRRSASRSARPSSRRYPTCW